MQFDFVTRQIKIPSLDMFSNTAPRRQLHPTGAMSIGGKVPPQSSTFGGKLDKLTNQLQGLLGEDGGLTITTASVEVVWGS